MIFCVSTPTIFATKTKYFIFSFVFFLFVLNKSKAQNYFANADFEHLNNCIEYKQNCASEAWFYVNPAVTPLINYIAVPQPFDGKDLLILPVDNMYNKSILKRTFVYTMLCCPLQAGKTYLLSFYLNTGGKPFAGIDFYFNEKEFSTANLKADSILPTISITKENVLNELYGWKHIKITFVATGKEKFCLLGNLNKDGKSYSGRERMNKAGDIFYFVDNISLTPVVQEKLCVNYQTNIDKLYAQNFRHSENALVVVSNTEIKFDTLTIPAVYFKTNESVIEKKLAEKLSKFANALKDKNINSLEVFGHTDSTGDENKNKTLSLARAESVKKYLANKLPALAKPILTEGKASTQPKADNNSSKGRSLNRRVEIIVSYTL
jgi:outer membrane protein OmpA-like peptidoglycan-associated protein